MIEFFVILQTISHRLHGEEDCRYVKLLPSKIGWTKNGRTEGLIQVNLFNRNSITFAVDICNWDIYVSFCNFTR